MEPLGGRRVPAEQCTALSKQSGERCRNRVQGGGVCRFHGGASPRARKAREARIVEMRRTALYPNAETRTPYEALRAAGASLDAALQGLEQLARDGGVLTAELVRELRAQAEASGRLQKAILDTGIAETNTKIAEHMADHMLRFMDAVFADVGFTPEQIRDTVNPIVSKHLKALAAIETQRY